MTFSMRVNIPVLLEAAYAAWAARDLDSAMSCFAKDVLFINHLPPGVAPFAGIIRGKAELARAFETIFDNFDFLDYRPVQITAEGGSFHSQVQFQYLHKATGLTYEGRIRHVWRIEGDKIVH